MPDRSPAPDAHDPARGVDGLLAVGGPVASAMGVYEDRPQQRTMAAAVLRAFEARRHLLVEAGTGVGKSFAYLVPALEWAARNRKKVAVATSTIALQEQLVAKDLPLLARALPFHTSFALVKGRGNFLCRRRMHMALEPTAEFFEDAEARRQVEAVAAWAERGAASRQDLDFTPREDVWDAVRAESGNCLHRQCPHFKACGYQRARERAHEASLLVMNHHVLLADLALRRSGVSFLPVVDAVIVDEAHDFEDAAAETLGARVGTRGVAQVLGRLWNDRRGTGLLRLHPDLSLRDLVDAARSSARSLFERICVIGSVDAPGAPVPLDAPLASDEGLADALEALGEALEDSKVELDRDLALEVGARATSCVVLAAHVREAVTGADAGHAAWIETTPRGDATITRAPIEAGPHLRKELFEKYGTVVLTSATLAVGRPPSFSYARERLGLAEWPDADELALGSPFHFERQARIVVRTDLPDPAANRAGFEAALPDAVLDAVRRTEGGAFVLFTSYTSMRRVAEAIRGAFEGDGLVVLVQGESLSRTAMLDRFRATNAVLFGVSSFWQGVDVPGAALRNVVIVKLPFEVPTHPLAKARQARIEREGKSAFSHLSLPHAALRLKQGFGRLIRRSTDRGLVVILDPRVVTKRYGRALLDSLPVCPIDLESFDMDDADDDTGADDAADDRPVDSPDSDPSAD